MDAESRRRWRALVVTGAMAAQIALGGSAAADARTGSAAPSGPADRAPTPCPAPAVPETVTSQGVEVTGCANRAAVRVGEKATFILIVRNTKQTISDPIKLDLNLRGVLDDGRLTRPPVVYTAERPVEQPEVAAVRPKPSERAKPEGVPTARPTWMPYTTLTGPSEGAGDAADFEWTGRLAGQAGARIVFEARAERTAQGDRRLTAVVEFGGKTMRLTVAVMDVTIKSSAVPTGLWPGGRVDYSILVRSVRGPATDVRIAVPQSGVVDDAGWVGDQRASYLGVGTPGEPPAPGYSDGVLRWRGDVPEGGVRITYSVRIGAAKRDHSLTNLVEDSYDYCATAGNQPRCSTVVLLPDLVVTKSAAQAKVLLGDQVRFRLTLANPGKAATGRVSVVDHLERVLDKAEYDRDARASLGSVDLRDDSLSWAGSISPGKTSEVTYSVRVLRLGDGELVNRVEAEHGNCAGAEADKRCASAVRITPPGAGGGKALKGLLNTEGPGVIFLLGSVLTGLAGGLVKSRFSGPGIGAGQKLY
ncbi:hypothetical protein [Rhizohabitans arisaemae]|uniref:DUF7927 domain-containing protein n=1 Tax=Rhizohabitans arisaemae TaxID=2720610 RepID=UPI0024B2840E|nr:hypothetical protein [Rhizohabitans arisaemae]